MNALVVALMTILNARLALESAELSLSERRTYLEQAISIGEMFLEIEQEKLDQAEVKINQAEEERDPRVDIHQYLSSQMNYLVILMKQVARDSSVSEVDLREVLQDRLSQSISP